MERFFSLSSLFDTVGLSGSVLIWFFEQDKLHRKVHFFFYRTLSRSASGRATGCNFQQPALTKRVARLPILISRGPRGDSRLDSDY